MSRRNPSLAIAPLRPVVVMVTRHVWYCDCPACPQRHAHRANRGEPITEQRATVQYVRPGASDALVTRALRSLG